MDFNIVDKLLNAATFGTEWVLWLLIFASIVSAAIMVERILYFTSIRVNIKNLSAQITEGLINEDIEGCLNKCNKEHSFEAQTIANGLKNYQKGYKAMSESMEGYIIGERHKLDKGLVVLGTLGNNAPFIGLFGTVLGIIKAFKDLGLNPTGGAAVVMSGISEALVATAVGLVVAIPAVIAFNTFNRIIKRKIANAESLMKILLTHKM